jgi:bacteriochlorophyll 4-vinyl reductase
MSEPRIGRFLVASLHQSIAELLPDRLEFYENWLSVSGLREGTIGLAPLLAVLSFLRAEGDVYRHVTTRAGEYAADWTVNGLPVVQRRVVPLLPTRLRTRAAIRTVRRLVQATYPGSRIIVRLRRDAASLDLRGSLFCEVREASPRPLCGFYAAATTRVLQRLAVPAEAQVESCRAAAGGPGCIMTFVLRQAEAGEPAAAS